VLQVRSPAEGSRTRCVCQAAVRECHACSGEQPIEVPWITWSYRLPAPLASAPSGDWPIPKYALPAHCARIQAGDSGQLNVDFLSRENHPCNFLAKDWRLPDSLSLVLREASGLELTTRQRTLRFLSVTPD
jgi:hypothetical protein